MTKDVSDEDVMKKSVSEVGERCGNCKFGQPVLQNMQQVECFADPPQITFLGVAPHPQLPGKMITRVEAMRPNLPRVTHACRHWKEKASALIGAKH